MKRPFGILLVSIIVLASFAFFGAYNVPSAKADPGGGSNLWNSFGTSYTSSGITITNPTRAFDESFALSSAANFQYSSATGYFSINNFENATSYLNNPLPAISQVDFKTVYNATANTGSELNDRYRIVYYVGPSATAQVLVDWRTDNYTYLNVNGFSDIKPYWVLTGSTPYLDSVNYPTSYISESNEGGIIGDFSFGDATGTFDTLKLQTYAKLTGDVQNQIRVWLYDDLQHRYRSAEFDLINPSNTTWGWVGPEFDFSTILNTLVKINNAKLYLEKAGTGSTVNVDAMRFLGQNLTAVRPNGDGTFTSWIGDYTQWDETVADGNMSYVYATGPNLDESSTLSDAPISDTWPIGKVRLTIIARQTTGDEQVQLMLVKGGTKYLGSTYTPTRDFAAYTSEWTVDPSDLNPWTWADINALEAGVRSLQFGGAWSGEMRVTQMYLDVLSNEVPLYVNGFDNSKKWTRVGASPYLGAVDNPTNILTQTTGDAVIGDFGFTDITGTLSKTYGKVFLEVYATQAADADLKRDDYIEVRLYNATSNDYNPIASITPIGAYSWMSSSDLSLLYLNSASNINDAKFELVKRSVGAQGQVSVDAVRLKVWNKDSAPETVTLTWENKPEPNDGVWSWNDIKNVRFVVETSLSGAVDAGCMFYLTEAWLTLTLPEAQLKVGPTSVTTTSGPVSQTLRPNAEGTFSELFSSGGQKPYRPATLGNGAYIAWTGTEGDWDDVTTPPAIYNDGDTTKVVATSGGLMETSTFTIATQAWSIAKIKFTIVARQTTGDEQVQLMIRAGTTDSFGQTFTPPALGTGTVSQYENYYTSEWATNPATGLAWQWSDIIAASYLQAGVKSIQSGGTFDGELRVTFVFMDIMPDTHYTFWDDVAPNGDTDYLYATSAVFNGYGRESSQLGDVAPPAWLPASVKIVVNAATTDGTSDDKFYLTAVINGKQYLASSLILPTTSYAEYSYNLVFNPATNAPWTWAEINALEVGVRTERVGATFTGTMKFTQLYVMALGPRYDADVFAQDVWDLYGFSFTLRYHTVALTALGYIVYSPLNTYVGALIDDAAGTVRLTFNLPGTPGHAQGFGGNATLAKIVFQSDSVGKSAMDIYQPASLTNTLAGSIDRTVTDGGYNDISVKNVVPSATTLSPGTAYTVAVTVKNEGNFTESFGIAAKYNATYTIGGTQVNNLAPNTQTVVNIPWTPLNIPYGKYNVSATVTDRYPSPTMNQIVDETDLTDNTYTYQWVTVLAHDIAITSVSTATLAYNGTDYRRDIIITVKNEGNFAETFNVTAYYDTFKVFNWTSGLGYETVTNLAAGATKTVYIGWNSTVFRFGKEYGNYTIWAEISTSGYGKKVQYEVDTTDNDNTFARPVMITIAGDVNGDRAVNIFDRGTISGCWTGPPPGPAGYDINVDINNDGAINIFDRGIASGNWGKSWG